MYSNLRCRNSYCKCLLFYGDAAIAMMYVLVLQNVMTLTAWKNKKFDLFNSLSNREWDLEGQNKERENWETNIDRKYTHWPNTFRTVRSTATYLHRFESYNKKLCYKLVYCAFRRVQRGYKVNIYPAGSLLVLYYCITFTSGVVFLLFKKQHTIDKVHIVLYRWHQMHLQGRCQTLILACICCEQIK